MAIFYSKTKNSFYDDTIHTPDQIPPDSKEISYEKHQQVLSEQSLGRKIVSDAVGYPITVEIKEKKLTKKQQNFLKIKELEDSVSPRLLREATLGIKESVTRLEDIQKQIEQLRG